MWSHFAYITPIFSSQFTYVRIKDYNMVPIETCDIVQGNFDQLYIMYIYANVRSLQLATSKWSAQILDGHLLRLHNY